MFWHDFKKNQEISIGNIIFQIYSQNCSYGEFGEVLPEYSGVERTQQYILHVQQLNQLLNDVAMKRFDDIKNILFAVKVFNWFEFL